MKKVSIVRFCVDTRFYQIKVSRFIARILKWLFKKYLYKNI